VRKEGKGSAGGSESKLGRTEALGGVLTRVRTFSDSRARDSMPGMIHSKRAPSPRLRSETETSSPHALAPTATATAACALSTAMDVEDSCLYCAGLVHDGCVHLPRTCACAPV
jgi:hypothetical protein